MACDLQTSDKNSNNALDEENEDLITLSGCSRITKWKFPLNQTRCPVCRLVFVQRSDTIAHYKDRHAQGSLLCPICIKPICVRGNADFKKHYQRLHPNNELPYGMNKTEPSVLITLTGSEKPMEWKFPENISECPTRGCGLFFETRSDIIAHYKEKHAHKFTLCIICKKVISATSLKSHYSSVHRKKDDEDLITLYGCGRITKWKFPTNQTRCLACPSESVQRSSLIAHYKECHAKTSILCPICVKPICAREKKNFKKHYQRMHPNERIPYHLYDSESNTNQGKSYQMETDDDPSSTSIKSLPPNESINRMKQESGETCHPRCITYRRLHLSQIQRKYAAYAAHKSHLSIGSWKSINRIERKQRSCSVRTTIAPEVNVESVEQNNATIEPAESQHQNVAVQTEEMQPEDPTSFSSEQNLAMICIEISDSEDKIASFSEPKETVPNRLTEVDPSATLSNANFLPKQEHVKRMNVLMMRPKKFETVVILSDSETDA